eukprot:SAG11_NODE_230_length_11943_cov_73.442962_6_plen_188_part_00
MFVVTLPVQVEIVSGFLMDTSLTLALKERTLFEGVASGPAQGAVPVVFNIHPFTKVSTLFRANSEESLMESVAIHFTDRHSRDDQPADRHRANVCVFTKEWNDDTLQWLTNCHESGLPIYGCTSVKAIATLSSMESNINPFMAASPTYLSLSELPREQRMHELNQPAVRQVPLSNWAGCSCGDRSTQ